MSIFFRDTDAVFDKWREDVSSSVSLCWMVLVVLSALWIQHKQIYYHMTHPLYEEEYADYLTVNEDVSVIINLVFNSKHAVN